MRVKQWLTLVGLMTAIGLLKVWQATSVTLAAYDVGERTAACRKLENETLWLKARVMHLQSPTQLARTMATRRLELVAWSPIASTSAHLTRLSRAASSHDGSSD